MEKLKNLLSVPRNLERIKELIRRFPVVAIDAIVGTSLALYLVDKSNHDVLMKIMMLAIPGFFLFLAGYIFSERRGKGKWLSNVIVLAILAVYFYYLPSELKSFKEIHEIRTFLLVFVSILAVMVAPYIRKGGIMGFWQYNKKLFLRLAFTAVSTGTLFLGIAASLASFDYLFGVHIDGNWYLRVWITIVGLVGTTVFSLGIPSDYENLESEIDYPKVVKIFSQFVLMPLLGLYMIILYLYGGKILLTGQWPKGLVSTLILIFSSVGIIANLLLYPEREKSIWIKRLSHVFWAAILPLLGLLYGAVYLRISDYGLTHERLFIVILGFWLLGLSLYFLFGKKYDIRIVFTSLILVIIFAVFGPINVFSVSSGNQMYRLQSILVKNKILVNGKIQKVDEKTVSEKDAQQITSIINYLDRVDRVNAIGKWFNEDWKASDNLYENTSRIMESMGLKYADYQYTGYDQQGIERRQYDTNNNDYAISSYRYLHKFDLYNENGYKNPKEQSRFSTDSWPDLFLELDGNTIILKQRVSDQEIKEISKINLDETVKNIVEEYSRSYYDLPIGKMTIETNNNFGMTKIYLENLSLEKKDGDWKVTHAQGMLLL